MKILSGPADRPNHSNSGTNVIDKGLYELRSDGIPEYLADRFVRSQRRRKPFCIKRCEGFPPIDLEEPVRIGSASPPQQPVSRKKSSDSVAQDPVPGERLTQTFVQPCISTRAPPLESSRHTGTDTDTLNALPSTIPSSPLLECLQVTTQEPGTAPVTLKKENSELLNKVKIMENHIVALEKRNIRTENCLEQALANKRLRDLMLDADKVHIGKLEELVLRYRHCQKEDQAGGGVESIDDETFGSNPQQEIRALREHNRVLQQQLAELRELFSTDSDAKYAELDTVRMDALWWRIKARYMQAKSWEFLEKFEPGTIKFDKEIEEESASISDMSIESGNPLNHRDK